MAGDCPRAWPGGASLGTKSCEVLRRLTQREHAWSNHHALRSVDQRLRRGAVSVPRHVDAVDKSIIEALQKNGREPFRRIAKRVGVSEATIRARYARLYDDDILQVTAVTNTHGHSIG